MKSSLRVLSLCLITAAAAGTSAQAGPDVVVSGIGATFTNNGSVGTIQAYSVQTISCNIGDAIAIWIDCTSGSNCNQHPVIGQEMYRLKANRFEQIGMSWLKHGFCAADAPNCINLVSPPGTYQVNSSCDWLGLFATDTYSASLNGTQNNLGPRSEVNPVTGVYPYPYVNQWNISGNAINKRLQVQQADINPSLNPSSRYFLEVHYVTSDEAADKRFNNASYREFSNSSYPTLSFNQAIVPMVPAIQAWKTADNSVNLQTVDSPSDGRYWVGAKAWESPVGTWNYEYAVYNHNSRRACSSVAISKPDDGNVDINDIGFHDVAYHSGEPYDGTDWPGRDLGPVVQWDMQPFSPVANSNALRWSTTYNFRFTSSRPPENTGEMTLGLFLSQSGGPDALRVSGLPTPSAPPPPVCNVDFNHNNSVEAGDIFSFLNAYFNLDMAANFNQDAVLDPNDIFAFLNAYFAAVAAGHCP